MKNLKLHISEGNKKIGKIWNVSLAPVVTCPEGCHCAKGCYAVNSYKLYPECKTAWDENTELAKEDPVEFFNQLDQWLTWKNTNKRCKSVRYFRFHVSGDCPTEYYASLLLLFVWKHPETVFMLYTKRYSWFMGKEIPANLRLYFSKDKFLQLPEGYEESGIPHTDIKMSDEKRPTGYFLCPGNCDICTKYNCGCYGDKAVNVVFNAHGSTKEAFRK